MEAHIRVPTAARSVKRQERILPKSHQQEHHSAKIFISELWCPREISTVAVIYGSSGSPRKYKVVLDIYSFKRSFE